LNLHLVHRLSLIDFIIVFPSLICGTFKLWTWINCLLKNWNQFNYLCEIIKIFFANKIFLKKYIPTWKTYVDKMKVGKNSTPSIIHDIVNVSNIPWTFHWPIFKHWLFKCSEGNMKTFNINWAYCRSLASINQNHGF